MYSKKNSDPFAPGCPIKWQLSHVDIIRAICFFIFLIDSIVISKICASRIRTRVCPLRVLHIHAFTSQLALHNFEQTLSCLLSYNLRVGCEHLLYYSYTRIIISMYVYNDNCSENLKSSLF